MWLWQQADEKEERESSKGVPFCRKETELVAQMPLVLVLKVLAAGTTWDGCQGGQYTGRALQLRGASERILNGGSILLCVLSSRDLHWDENISPRAEQRIPALVRAAPVRSGICLRCQGFSGDSKGFCSSNRTWWDSQLPSPQTSSRKRANLQTRLLRWESQGTVHLPRDWFPGDKLRGGDVQAGDSLRGIVSKARLGRRRNCADATEA